MFFGLSAHCSLPLSGLSKSSPPSAIRTPLLSTGSTHTGWYSVFMLAALPSALASAPSSAHSPVLLVRAHRMRKRSCFHRAYHGALHPSQSLDSTPRSRDLRVSTARVPAMTSLAPCGIRRVASSTTVTAAAVTRTATTSRPRR